MWKATTIVPARGDNGLDQRGDGGGGEKWLGWGYVLTTELNHVSMKWLWDGKKREESRIIPRF